ncbi:MAG TPA: hypothetical protein VJ837_05900, partial [Candidatus Paceibacterota bacterium]|nr:hypothetical protein [Candidatus Paceibacterota bacterium]
MSHRLAKKRIVEEALERPGHRSVVALRDQESRFTMSNRVLRARAVTPYYRLSGRHAFEVNDAEGFH